MSTLFQSNTIVKGTELLALLTSINNKEKTWEDVNLEVVLDAMVLHIGSPNSDLREMVYRSFYMSIIHDQLDYETLKKLLDYSLKHLLFKGIGESGTDSVFTRAFTTILIAVIINKDIEVNFLPKETFDEVKNEIKKYIELEQDVRGYVPVKGWAHSIAHVADTCEELIKSEKMDEVEYFSIIEVLLKTYCTSPTGFLHGEDDRVVTAVLAMLKKKVGLEELKQFVKGIPDLLKSQKEELSSEKYWFVMANCVSLLKSLFIGVSDDPLCDSLQQTIRTSLSQI
jgi:ribosomal protein S13